MMSGNPPEPHPDRMIIEALRLVDPLRFAVERGALLEDVDHAGRVVYRPAPPRRDWRADGR